MKKYALKIFDNSVYGTLSEGSSPFDCKGCGVLVTAIGRYFLEYTAQWFTRNRCTTSSSSVATSRRSYGCDMLQIDALLTVCLYSNYQSSAF